MKQKTASPSRESGGVSRPSNFLPALAAAGCLGLFALWTIDWRPPRAPETLRHPVVVQTPPPALSTSRNPGTLIVGEGQPSTRGGSWPQFRGADRTNIAPATARLARSWPEEGPPVLWRIEVGEGHAGVAIHRGRVYLIDYDREKKEDAIRCLSLDDGSEIWRYTYSVDVKRNHGMSRTVPAVSDRYVVTIGPKCHVVCLDAESGERVWKMDLVEQYGAVAPPWYAGQCPLIEGDRVILAPGGSPLMMAVELATGEMVWRTPDSVDDSGMTHSSIVAMEFGGVRQYIYCARLGVFSVAADDGRVLWDYPEWKIGIANIPTPVIVGADRILFSGGYNSGCALVRLVAEGEVLRPEKMFQLEAKVFGSDQQTPILYEDHIYGVAPKPSELVCLDLDGNRLWSSGADRQFGIGPYLLADELLLVLNDKDGRLHLAEATPEGYRELARAQLLEGHDAWGPMAFAEGRLILRDLTEMICVDVGATP
jgi:outer membrane protein assembly factor BamB